MSNNGEQMELKLKPTSATEWRKMREEGVIVPLPSGKAARLRPVGIEELVRRGRIPDDLSGMAAVTIWKDAPSYEQVNALGKKAIDFLNIIVESAFLEPRIVEGDPGEGEISIDDVDIVDKHAVFQFVTGPTQALHMFRSMQTEHVGDVPARDENGAPSKSAD